MDKLQSIPRAPHVLEYHNFRKLLGSWQWLLIRKVKETAIQIIHHFNFQPLKRTTTTTSIMFDSLHYKITRAKVIPSTNQESWLMLLCLFYFYSLDLHGNLHLTFSIVTYQQQQFQFNLFIIISIIIYYYFNQ